MTSDDALLWARERCAQWAEAVDNHTVAAMFRVGERDYYQPLQMRAEAYRAGHAAGQSAADAERERLAALLNEAHDTMHETTAVLTANDCAKVAAVMARIRAALEGRQP